MIFNSLVTITAYMNLISICVDDKVHWLWSDTRAALHIYQFRFSVDVHNSMCSSVSTFLCVRMQTKMVIFSRNQPVCGMERDRNESYDTSLNIQQQPILKMYIHAPF